MQHLLQKTCIDQTSPKITVAIIVKVSLCSSSSSNWREGGREGRVLLLPSFLPRWFHLSFSALVVQTCLFLLCKQEEEEKEEEDKRLTVS
jgi:hypothetical protein